MKHAFDEIIGRSYMAEETLSLRISKQKLPKLKSKKTTKTKQNKKHRLWDYPRTEGQLEMWNTHNGNPEERKLEKRTKEIFETIVTKNFPPN